MAKIKCRIKLNHLMYVRYRHRDLAETHQFLEDFGLVAVAKHTKQVLYSGFGKDPVSYMSEQSSDGTTVLLGGGWAVDSLEDLELAATLPNASSITISDEAIGGKYVTIQDPVGAHVYLHWGYHERVQHPTELPKSMKYNTWEKKSRLGEFQRLPDGPSFVHKLGHYGLEVDHSQFESLRSWYLDNFALTPTDALFNPKTGDDVMQFMHLDRGEEFVDHHVSLHPPPVNSMVKSDGIYRHSSSAPETWEKGTSLTTPVSKSTISTARCEAICGWRSVDIHWHGELEGTSWVVKFLTIGSTTTASWSSTMLMGTWSIAIISRNEFPLRLTRSLSGGRICHWRS